MGAAQSQEADASGTQPTPAPVSQQQHVPSPYVIKHNIEPAVSRANKRSKPAEQGQSIAALTQGLSTFQPFQSSQLPTIPTTFTFNPTPPPVTTPSASLTSPNSHAYNTAAFPRTASTASLPSTTHANSISPTQAAHSTAAPLTGVSSAAYNPSLLSNTQATVQQLIQVLNSTLASQSTQNDVQLILLQSHTQKQINSLLLNLSQELVQTQRVLTDASISAQQQLAQSENHHQQLQSLNEQHKLEQARLTDLLRQSQQQLAERDLELAGLQKQQLQQANQHEQMLADYQRMEDECKQQLQQLADYQEQVALAETALGEQEEQWQAKVAELQAEHEANVTALIDKSNENMTSYNAEVEQREQQWKDRDVLLSEKLSIAEERLTHSKQQLQAVEQSKDEIQVKHAEVEAVMAEMNQQLVACEEHIAVVELERNELVEHLQQRDHDIAALEAQLEGATAEVQQVAKERDEADAEVDRLKFVLKRSSKLLTGSGGHSQPLATIQQ